MLADVEVFTQGREGTLRTVEAFADAAARADRRSRIRLVQIQTVTVDESVGVSNLASQSDGEDLCGLSVSSRSTFDRASNPEVSAAVGHLCDLGHDLARIRERLVDVPQRARTAAGGEVESGGGLTLRHVSGTVDTDEHERNPAKFGALQSREAVADRLVARGIEGGHALDVVPEVLGDVVELAVGSTVAAAK